MSTPFSRVLIVGGGVAGPALGLFLKRAGIHSTVFEAYAPSQGVGGGLGLGPNGMRVLDALGVASELEVAGTCISSYRFRNARGSTLAGFALEAERRFGQPMLGVGRASLAEAVARQAHREGLEIAYQKRLVGIEQRSDGVVARFDDGTCETGDLLIGADGVHSTTRHLALPESPEPGFTGMVGIGGFVDDDRLPSFSPLDRQSMTFVFGAQGFFGYSGCGEGRAMWWTNLPRTSPLSRAEMLQTPTASLRQELLQRFGGYFAPVPDLISSSGPILQLNVFDIQSLPRWHNGRVLVIGDAAHAVSPNAGQGASLALEDAMYLARLLRDTPTYSDAFGSFERERKPRVERIVAEGRKRGVDKQIVGPVQARIRELMMSVMLSLFGKHADDWVWGYQIDWDTEP